MYRDTLAEEFSAVTPENEMKWGMLQPQRSNQWDFAQAEAIVDFALDNELAIKGHTLVWHQQLPTFMVDTLALAKLEKYTGQHIGKTVRHFKDDIVTWDVVNEAIAEDGSFRDSIFSRAFGPDYVELAFREAHKADHDALLLYNDYNTEMIGPKSDGVYALVAGLVDDGVPIHGVGFQMHLDANQPPSVDALTTNFARFAELGLLVNISELDVRIANLSGSLAERLAEQKRVYHHAIAACVRTPACTTVTMWGFTDRYSWIDSVFGPDDPLVFDEGYRRKPAYFGAFDAFVGLEPDPLELPPNVIPNGSFEAGADGWFAFGSSIVEATDSDAQTGYRSGRATGRTASWNGIAHDLRSVTTRGRTYAISAGARIGQAASASLGMTAVIACEGQATEFRPLARANATDTEWSELAGELVVPDCPLQQLTLYFEGPDAGVDILIDDIAVRPQPASLGPNLVTNPGFETNSSGWIAWGGAAIATTAVQAHGGQQSGVVTGRSGSWQGGVWELGTQVTPGATYEVGLFGRVSGAASDNGFLTAHIRCAGQPDEFRRLGSATLTDTGWTEVTGDLVVPPCSLNGIAVYLEGPASGVDLYIDDLSVREQLELGPVNLVDNGEFELGTAGWVAWGGANLTTTDARAHGGSRSAVVTGRTGDWQGPVYDLFGSVMSGTSYEAEAWVSISGTASSPVHLTARIGCAGQGQEYRRLGSVSANDGTWTRLSGVLAMPECTIADVVVYAEGPAAGLDIFIDDVVVTPAP